MRSSEKRTILAGHWTIKLGRQNGKLLHWPKCSSVSTKTTLWKLLLGPCASNLSANFHWAVTKAENGEWGMGNEVFDVH